MKARIVKSTSRPGELSIRAWDKDLERYSARAFFKGLMECFQVGQDVIIKECWGPDFYKMEGYFEVADD